MFTFLYNAVLYLYFYVLIILTSKYFLKKNYVGFVVLFLRGYFRIRPFPKQVYKE